MKYFSTFSGIGGFEIGIQNAWRTYVQKVRGGQEVAQGVDEERQRLHTVPTETALLEGRRANEHPHASFNQGQPYCVGYSEIDKYAISVYERQFNGHRNYGDITKINAAELPDFDCLVGGFPCQAFSIAGKRRGFKDTRGTLFFDLARILKAKTPRLFVFENVKGLLSHDNGNTFKTIIAAIDELGYDCQWQVLNSKNHGVPQNRERIIIVGHLRGTPRPQVFPISGTDQKDIVQLNNPTHSNDRVYGTDGVSPTLNTMQGGNRQPFIAAQRGRYNASGEIEQQLEPRFDGLSNTLTAVQKDNMLYKPAIRRLTPIECERLQAFPDDWTKYGEDEHGVRVLISDTQILSDTQRYKMCGNAVTTNVIRDVFVRIFDGSTE